VEIRDQIRAPLVQKVLEDVRAERAEKPFVTSAEVALMRAMGARDPSILGSDSLAHHFLPTKYRLSLSLGELGRRITERVSPGCYGFHNARTKFFDGVFERVLAQGVEQVVILGAGNDSRPYRMPALESGVRVFELDLPATQARKLRLLRQLYGEAPAHVRFVPTDFETDALDERLIGAGFDPASRSLFSWEGVSYYLTDEAVDRVLHWISSLSAPGSSLVFDYSLRSYTDERDLSTYGGKQLIEWLHKRGMRYHFGAEPEDMAKLLAQHGFQVKTDIGPTELEASLGRAGRKSKWRVWGNFRMVHTEAKAP
jgi:methyltransferase (TIGR00027 family)